MGATEEKIAQFIAETPDEKIPEESLKSAKLGCFDCVGVMLAGAASPPGKIVAKVVKEAGGKPETTVVGTGVRTTPILGALANGTVAHALDFDDMTGGWAHPSCVLFPPIISLGERMSASGREILNAYSIGFRVGTAIASGCNYVQMERGFHSTAIYGTMAATAACARLLKLNVEQTIMALGTAGSMAGGIFQNVGTYTKGFHAGLAGHNAVTACLLAQEGWTGTDSVFESQVGFLSGYMGRDMYHLETIRDSLDKPAPTQEVAIKKYPCCGENQAVLDSFFSLVKENNFRFDDIQRVDVDNIPYVSPILLYTEVTSGFQGKFSLRYTLATAMIDGRIDIDSYSEEKMRRAQLKEALKKLELHVLLPWDPRYKTKIPEYPVTITLKDGRTFRKGLNRHVIHGTPADPLTQQELFAKFKSNAALSLPRKAVDRACDLWWNLDKMSNISEGLEAVAGAEPVRA